MFNTRGLDSSFVGLDTRFDLEDSQRKQPNIRVQRRLWECWCAPEVLIRDFETDIPRSQ